MTSIDVEMTVFGWKCDFSMQVTRICFHKTMTLTQGYPYLRNNDVYLCFIIFCIYTVRYKEVNQNIPDSPNTGIFFVSLYFVSP